MKKKGLFGLLVICLFVMLLSCTALAATPVSKNGRLSVKGTKIVNSKGKAFQIKGVSTHGLSWYPEYVSKTAFKELRDKWGVNTVRLAMYTAEYNGYCTGGSQNKKNLEKLIDKGVKAATDLGMYVIIDWHILSDNDPNTYKSQAVSFFKKMAKKYKNHKNVLYEICNEPNGGVSWSRIKTYANKVISAIRKYDKKAIIIVGTPTWSQDVDIAAKSPIKKKNIAYTLHFYADTHRDSYRAKAQSAINAGLPLLVSEFSICDASGNGSVNTKEANKWISFLNKNKIGYVAWSLSNKAETSALIKSSCSKKSGWTKNDLSATGKWLVKTYGGKLIKGGSTAAAADDEPETEAAAPDQSTAGSDSNQGTSNGNSGQGTAGNDSGQGTTGGNSGQGAAGGDTNTSGKTVKATSSNTKATIKKGSTWKSGKRYFTQYDLTITNKSGSTVSDWKVKVTFKKAIKKSSGWGATFSYKSKYVTLKPEQWNKTIAAKQSVSVGFILSSSVKNNKVKSVKIIK